MTRRAYFEGLYAESPDPWQLSENAYERRKHALTAASLPRERYRRGFEPGCSIGVLTQLLAGRCDELIATDPVAAPLQGARSRVPDVRVSFEKGSVPGDWPPGEFDLVVVSELLYYLSLPDRVAVLRASESCLADDGHLVLVHWRHEFEVAECTGDEAHRDVTSTSLVRLVRHEEDDFLIEVFAHPTA